MTGKATFTIAEQYVVNKGLPDEQTYDAISEYHICMGLRSMPVFIVKRARKYGIIDHMGKVITPLEYDYIERRNVSYGSNCFFAKKNGKTGIITSHNQTIFPFLYDRICNRDLENIKVIVFEDATTGKYGLARWPSGGLVHEAQWDEVKFICLIGKGEYIECGEKVEEYFWNLPPYRWNIINPEGKLLFDSCRYAFFSGYGTYNVATKNVGDYDAIGGYLDCDIDIYYKDGTVLYSGKCHWVEHLDYYNAFVINNPGSYGRSKNYSLHIYYRDEDGDHRLYHQEFELEDGDFSGCSTANWLVERNPELKKLVC